jgi:hypothetical protein
MTSKLARVSSETEEITEPSLLSTLRMSMGSDASCVGSVLSRLEKTLKSRVVSLHVGTAWCVFVFCVWYMHMHICVCVSIHPSTWARPDVSLSCVYDIWCVCVCVCVCVRALCMYMHVCVFIHVHTSLHVGTAWCELSVWYMHTYMCVYVLTSLNVGTAWCELCVWYMHIHTRMYLCVCIYVIYRTLRLFKTFCLTITS